MKERVKGVLNYRKPALWVIAASVIICIVVAVCFMTNPKKDEPDTSYTEDKAADDSGENEIVRPEVTEAGQEETASEELENLGVEYTFDGENYVVEDDMVFMYKKTLTGRSPNAARSGMYIVLTNDPDITFEDVNRSLYSSNSSDWLSGTIIIGMHVIDENGNPIENIDNSIGLSISVKDITPTGCTLVFFQHDGNVTGELQTGPWYELQVKNEDGDWIDNSAKDIEKGWEEIAYLINKKETTELTMNWEQYYGYLKCGHYRIAKKVMDYRAPGDYDEYDVYAEFDIADVSTSAKNVTDWMDITFPDGYSIGDFRDDIGWQGGSLILPRSYEAKDSDTAPIEWQYSGLITGIPAKNTNIEYSEGIPKSSGVPMDNHTFQRYIGTIGLERSTNQWPALAIEESHDLYTHAEIEKMKQDGVDTEKMDLSADYWTYWFVKEGEDTYYVLTLSAKEFSKEEADDIALSVSIK